MTLTSVQFYIFLALSVLVYYIFPKKLRPYILLAFGFGFIVLSSKLELLIYLILSIVISCICIRFKKSKIALAIGILANLALLFVTKYLGLGMGVPLGISFYTLTIIGLLLDNYWGISEVGRNPFKTALFISYWPCMTSGPILKYSETDENLLSGGRLEYKNLSIGVFRIALGVFKKLIISERLAVVTSTIYSDPVTYCGWYLFLAAALFMLQLYTDFSGCMDIVLGASRLFGIVLPENFLAPFYARTVQEYWQRWHITLGTWLKNYVLYPILRTKLFINMSKALKEKVGKKASREIPAQMAALCVWLLIGLWHGFGTSFVFGMGLWFWACITIEQYFDPLKKLPLLQIIRTFILVCIGNVFFSAGSMDKAINIFKLSFRKATFVLALPGISKKAALLCAIAMVIVLLLDLVSLKKNIFESYAKRPFALRLVILLVIVFVTIVLGKYGPGYDPHEFIYKGF